MERLLKIEEVAPQAGLSRQALFAACRAGQFPHVRIGRRIRIPVSGLESWIAQQVQKNQKPQNQGESLATAA